MPLQLVIDADKLPAEFNKICKDAEEWFDAMGHQPHQPRLEGDNQRRGDAPWLSMARSNRPEGRRLSFARGDHVGEKG
jgi:hypothetical protein